MPSRTPGDLIVDLAVRWVAEWNPDAPVELVDARVREHLTSEMAEGMFERWIEANPTEALAFVHGDQTSAATLTPVFMEVLAGIDRDLGASDA